MTRYKKKTFDLNENFQQIFAHKLKKRHKYHLHPNYNDSGHRSLDRNSNILLINHIIY